MKYPKFPKPGDVIGYIAPSFGPATEPYKTQFASALEFFEGQGYRTWLGPNVYESCGIGISNTPAKCGAELQSAYCSSDCDAIISCGGGELMCETISNVDWKAMAETSPKLYMGYSDNTNATFLLATLCDTASIYGNCAPSFGMRPLDPSLLQQWDMFTGKITKVHGFETFELESLKDESNPLVPYNLTEESLPVVALDSKGNDTVHGRLLGGCLDVLTNLCGTRFDKVKEFAERYKEDGILWYLESCDLNVMSIRRALWNLKEAGWFQHASGFLIGRPLQYHDEAFGIGREEAVMGILADLDVPVILDLDFGHLPPMLPMVNGAIAHGKVEDGIFTLEYEFR